MEAYDWGGEVPASLGAVPFDVILGTDVAYYEHLYAPFVQASSSTVKTVDVPPVRPSGRSPPPPSLPCAFPKVFM